MMDEPKEEESFMLQASGGKHRIPPILSRYDYRPFLFQLPSFGIQRLARLSKNKTNMNTAHTVWRRARVFFCSRMPIFFLQPPGRFDLMIAELTRLFSHLTPTNLQIHVSHSKFTLGSVFFHPLLDLFTVMPRQQRL